MRIHPITLLLLLFPVSAFSQVTACYFGGGTAGFGDDNLKQDQLYFQFSVTGDTLVISPNENLRSASYYRMTHNAPYMERTGTYGSSPVNYVWPRKNSIMILQYDGNYLLFNKDQARAKKLAEVADRPGVLAFRDSIKTVIETAIKANKDASTALTKRIINTYAASLHSVRDDPTLQKDMIKWSGQPGTTAYIMDNNYQVIRSYTGQVLNKNITGIIKFRQNGKCYIQWRDFGYECLGGGKFSTDITTYNRSGYTVKASTSLGSIDLREGVSYEIDCN
jgi:hypothetical protein